jgi:hypothetical protein
MADAGLLKRICAEDGEALDLIDQAEQGKHGGDHTSEESNVDNINVALRPTGTSRQHIKKNIVLLDSNRVGKGNIVTLAKPPDLHARRA